MQNIGIVVAMEEEAINIKKNLEALLSKYELTFLHDDVSRYRTKDKNIYIIVSGIGMNNAVIACSRLQDWFHCTRIYNIGTCGCLKADNVRVGDIKKFSNNIINYAFRLHPLKYGFDDCNIGSRNLLETEDLLVTCSYYGTAEILEDKELKLNNIKNVFVDMEGYGVAAFCIKRSIYYEIIKVVSDFGNEDVFDKNVEQPDTYHNLKNIISQILSGEK